MSATNHEQNRLCAAPGFNREFFIRISCRSRLFVHQLVILLITGTFLLVASTSSQAFSVLAHQAVVDQAWDSALLPLLHKRFPNANQQELKDAHAYARGGSHLPDLGYFPLGSRLFTDLLHYVCTGDFISRLLAEARSANEYAFALGMLGHYEADVTGHTEATNLAVPIIYPKLAMQYGKSVPYADSTSAHLATEFRFDVLQVAHSEQIPNRLEQSIEFKVPQEFLERVFRETYGLDLNDLFESYDVAITTYRWGFRMLINEGTGIAWQLYREDIESLRPGTTSKQFVQEMSRADFVKLFGKTFLEPGYFVRFVGFVGNLLPNVGPFKRLPYKPLPRDVQELYFHAFYNACHEYLREVGAVDRGRPFFPNLNLDTGRATQAGEYSPADKAYVELLQRHAKDHFIQMPKALEDDMLRHFRDRNAAVAFQDSKSEREKILSVVDEFETQRSRARNNK